MDIKEYEVGDTGSAEDIRAGIPGLRQWGGSLLQGEDTGDEG